MSNKKLTAWFILSLLSLFLVLTTACQIGSSPEPTKEPIVPAPQLDPDKLGVNFWTQEMMTPNNSKQLFRKDTVGHWSGMVLLDFKNPSYNAAMAYIESEGADLVPLIRYDYQPGATVPNCIKTERPFKLCSPDDNTGNCATCNEWRNNFTKAIAQANHVRPENLGNDPIAAMLDPNNRQGKPIDRNLFIVGNEPWLDGGINREQYAAAYTIIWKAVHLDPGTNESRLTNEIQLLAAGQNFKSSGVIRNEETGETIEDAYVIDGKDVLTTVTWPALVAKQIKEHGADVDAFAIHTYGYGLEETGYDNCESPTNPDQPCGWDNELGNGWQGDDSFLNYRDQINFNQHADSGIISQALADELNEKDIYITEFNTYTGKGPSNDLKTVDLPANNYPTWWIIEAANVIAQDSRVKGLLWFTGSAEGGWNYFALTEDFVNPGEYDDNETQGLPCAREDFRLITGISTTGCNPQTAKLSLDTALVWTSSYCTAYPTGTFLTGQTNTSDPDRLVVEASPATTYNLNWASAGQVYAGTFDWVPEKGKTATFTLFDKAGNMVQKRLYNPGPQKIPGCDHPDDNHSAASPTLPPGGQWQALPNGARTTPQVAIYNTGFAGNLLQLLWQLGEPAAMIDPNFDPAATAAQYPVLLLPSGSLYGAENSLLLKTRLKLYAEAGGTLVAFAQQHGYEFGVLPVPDEVEGMSRNVGGYGWQEDNSCFRNAFYLENYHPALAGFSNPYLTAHVDGYFTTYPTNSTVLLSRTQNGMPGLLTYPYPPSPSGGGVGGGGGRIIVTSIYDDWGSINGQVSQDARILLRDLLSWATAPDALNTYAPGQTVNLSVPVANETDAESATVRVSLISPAREIVQNIDFDTPLAPGESTILSFDVTAQTPLGIWRTDATLLNGRGQPMGARLPAAAFAIANPPDTISPVKPLALSITAPSDRFPRGSRGEFTFHVFNNSDQDKAVTIQYGLPHHTWEERFDPQTGESYGYFYNRHQDLTVPAGQEVTYVYTPTIFTTDRLWSRLVEDGRIQAYAHYAVYPSYVLASSITNLQTDAPAYGRGSQVTVTATTPNKGRQDVVTWVTVYDTENTIIYKEILPLSEISEVVDDSILIRHTFTVSPTAHSGMAKLALEIGGYGSAARTTFRVSGSPLGSYFPDDLTLTPGLNQNIPLHLINVNPFLNVNEGEVSIRLVDGTDTLATSYTQTFTLAGKQETTLSFNLDVPQLGFTGDYHLAVNLVDEYDRQPWQTAALPMTNTISAVLDQPAHRVRQTAVATLTLHNPGPFVQNLTLNTLLADFGFDETRQVTLDPYQSLSQSYTIPIPTAISPGLHTLDVTTTLPDNSRRQAAPAAIYVPESQLQTNLFGTAVTEGDILTVTLTNIGGVDTTGAYDIGLYDATGAIVAAFSAAGQPLPLDQPLAVPVTIPEQVKAGYYSVNGLVTDEKTQQQDPFYRVFELAGLTAGLTARTDAETYLTIDNIAVSARITNTGTPLTGADLELTIFREGTVEAPLAWQNFNSDNSGLAYDTANAVAVDAAGNIWAITSYNVEGHRC